MPRDWLAYFRIDEAAPEGRQVRHLVDGLWGPYEPFPSASAFLSQWAMQLTEITATDVPCPGCAMIAGEATRIVVRNWPDAVAIKPRPAGLVVGHTLVLSKTHVIDAAESPMITGMVTSRAAELAAERWGTNFNLMINSGTLADQTLFHLHVHIWPRRRGDNLGGPWTAQQQVNFIQTAGAGSAGHERRPDPDDGSTAEPIADGSAGTEVETSAPRAGCGSLGPSQTPVGGGRAPATPPTGLHQAKG
jgi:histidine triad (HIT) family protein